MDPAVFLDRDNTLIANDGDLGDPDQVRLLDGVVAGLLALREAGYRLVVITNQGGVARGKFAEGDVDAVHRRIVELIELACDGQTLIERFYYCPFHPEGTVAEYRREHPWRKPGGGMLLQAAVDLDLDLARSWMIGDQPRDVRAGQAAGCRTALIGSDQDVPADLQPTLAASSFGEAVQGVLRTAPPREPINAASGVASATAASGTTTETRTELATAVAEAKPLSRITPSDPDTTTAAMQRAIRDLTDELRSRRLRETEFTAFRMAALITQLLVLLVSLLGLLQLGETEIFLKWMIGAVVLQLFTLTLLVADGRG